MQEKSVLVFIVLVVCSLPVGRCERQLFQLNPDRNGYGSTSPLSGKQVHHQMHPQSACEHNEECVPAARCSSLTAEMVHLKICTTAFNTDGVCCPTRRGDPSPGRISKRSIDYEHVSANAVREGRRQYAETVSRANANRKVITAKRKVEPPFHQFLQPPHKDSPREQEHDAYEHIFASRNFAEATNLTVEQRQQGNFADMPSTLRKRCIPAARCNRHAKYRSFDGTCNNPIPERTSWGAAGHPFEKLLPPAYEDGVWAPRVHSVTGRLLASPRTISSTLIPDLDRPDHNLNLLLMQFGQFIAHDFTRSSSMKLGKDDIECCSRDGSRPLRGEQAHIACMPIEVSPDDPFYSKFGVRCLNFVRLALATDGDCKLGYAKQLSKVTHFIDASTVYGSNQDWADSLRTFRNGQLRNSFPVGIELLPFNRDPSVCEPWAQVCFEAGDDRVNQIISLVQVHVLFLREHNRLASSLSHLNPNWDDETIYQEARKIVIAQIQNIVYNEYLPLIVGWDKVKQYGLLSEGTSHSDIYNANVKPVVLSEVSGAAFRFGHSTVDGNLRIQHRREPAENIPIHTVFDDPSRVLHPTSFDDYMFSLGDQSQQQLDNSLTLGLTGLLFAGREPFGSDLASLNIQRGRDHALRPYNDYRVWAGIPPIRKFHEMGPIGSKLEQVYESPEDIDLWIGGLLEAASGSSLVGETFGHLIAEQFARLKYGDRYFYSNGPDSNPGAFTSKQLEQIQRVSLASVICANVDKRFDFYQAPRAFLKSTKHNVPIPCDEFHDIHLGAWKH